MRSPANDTIPRLERTRSVAQGPSPLTSRLRFFLRSPLRVKLSVIDIFVTRLKGQFYYRRIFAEFGRRSILFRPSLIMGPEFMRIGQNVWIRQGARMTAIVADSEHL